MAGHSHSSNIKHKKALVDNKRGKLYSKLSKAIIVAAKMGGGDPEGNIRLRTAIADARAVSMPKDNITRAIKKGTGELEGGNLDNVLYEGYGPGGVAVLCDILTDNRNRTASEVRKIFDDFDGKLGGANSVGWMFDRRALFVISTSKVSEEKLIEVALEAGASDIKQEGDTFEVISEAELFAQVADALEKAGIETEVKQLTRIPNTTVEVTDPNIARKVLKLIDLLDDNDDVESVSANYHMPDDVLAAAEA